MRHSTRNSTQSQPPVRVPGVPQIVEDEGRSYPVRPDAMPGPGDLVGRYTLLETIGEGGMGVVYRAHDPTVGRMVALKVARGRQSPLSPRSDARMRREAQALGRVRDRGVVGLYEFGEDDGGCFLALELVEGVHFRRWLNVAARTPIEIAAIIEQAALGLAAVHRSGLLHRDLKPTNILVGRDGRVVLVDFGLALGTGDLDATSSGSHDIGEPTCRTRMTRRDMVVGTTHYMSPEQLLGRDLDARSDVFALGVTLYEALWGSRPYPASTAYDLAVAYDRGVAPSPPASVPQWLRRAVLDAVAIDPAARTPGARELAEALRGPPRTTTMRWAGPLLALALAGASFTAGYAVAEPSGQAAKTHRRP